MEIEIEQHDQNVGKQVGYEAFEHIVDGAQAYCESERLRIEMVNRPAIIALQGEVAILGERERDLKERIHRALAPGDFRNYRRRSLYCWAVVAFLAVAGFFFTLMAFDPYRLGWKGYLYSMGIAVVCPFCVDKFLESWGSTKLVRTLATAACVGALASLVLFALIRGDVLAQYIQTAAPAIVLDADPAPQAAPHGNFFDATLGYLQAAMALLAFAMELGAGLALYDAMRLGSNSGEDYRTLCREREAVCQDIVVRVHTLAALQNAPQAFVAQFWRDFNRALLNGAKRSAMKTLSLILICLLLFGPGLANGAEPVHVVIALDLSESVAVKGGDSKAEFEKNTEAIGRILAHLPARARVTVLGITTDSFAQPHLLLDARLDEDEGYFKERLAAGRRQIAGAWKQRCVRLKPEFPHSDIFGALLVASELFRQSAQGRKILVVFSDMRQETALINLESQPLINADRSLAIAEKKHLLADFKGVEVYALGVDAAGKAVSYWDSLHGFWAEYFRRAGARLESYSILREPPDIDRMR